MWSLPHLAHLYLRWKNWFYYCDRRPRFPNDTPMAAQIDMTNGEVFRSLPRMGLIDSMNRHPRYWSQYIAWIVGSLTLRRILTMHPFQQVYVATVYVRSSWYFNKDCSYVLSIKGILDYSYRILGSITRADTKRRKPTEISLFSNIFCQSPGLQVSYKHVVVPFNVPHRDFPAVCQSWWCLIAWQKPGEMMKTLTRRTLRNFQSRPVFDVDAESALAFSVPQLDRHPNWIMTSCDRILGSISFKFHQNLLKPQRHRLTSFMTLLDPLMTRWTLSSVCTLLDMSRIWTIDPYYHCPQIHTQYAHIPSCFDGRVSFSHIVSFTHDTSLTKRPHKDFGQLFRSWVL